MKFNTIVEKLHSRLYQPLLENKILSVKEIYIVKPNKVIFVLHTTENFQKHEMLLKRTFSDLDLKIKVIESGSYLNVSSNYLCVYTDTKYFIV